MQIDFDDMYYFSINMVMKNAVHDLLAGNYRVLYIRNFR